MHRLKSFKNRLLFSIMIFAFLWVIIGDLVSMHINVIYNVNIQNEQPYIKSDKSSTKVKKDISSDDEITSLSTFIKEDVFSVKTYEDFNIIHFTDIQSNFHKVITEFSTGRSPPLS